MATTIGSPRSIAKMMARVEPLLKRLDTENPVVIEIGVYYAQMSEHLLTVRDDLTWHGVDPWLGVEDHSHTYIATGDPHATTSRDAANDCYKSCVGRLARFGTRATIHRQRSTDAAPGFKRGVADLVFVDADHSYEATLADLRAWWPVVAPGGWLGGHDINHPDNRTRFKLGVDQAVYEFGAEIQQVPELDGGLTYWFKKPSYPQLQLI